MIIQGFTLFVERHDFFLKLFLEHMKITLIAIGISIIIGGMFGIAISEFKKLTKLTLGSINFIYTIPSISMLGFLIPFSGVGNTTAIIALTIYGLLPMVRSTYTGLSEVDPAIIEAARGMGSTRWQILYKIKLPLALNVIMSGIRNMVTMTIALAGIASFIGAGGLGVAIYRGITTNNSAMTLVGSLLIAMLALVADGLVGLIQSALGREKRNRKWVLKVILVVSILGIFIGSIGMLKSDGRDETINIATKPMTEQQIMGEMLKALIEEKTDYKVKLFQGVGGGTSNIQPAMMSGKFHIYPEYTGTGWNMVLNEKSVYQDKDFQRLKERYARELNLRWLGMYGFNNSYGILLNKDIAEKYNIKTISQLAPVASELIFGGEYDFFERKDGYEGLTSEYGLKFKSTKDMDIGLKYHAFKEGEIQAMVVFTTDGQLAESGGIVLEDDKNFYPSYKCGNVVNEKILKEYPKLKTVLKKLEGTISDSEMAMMNHKVEDLKESPHKVAVDFLKRKGLL